MLIGLEIRLNRVTQKTVLLINLLPFTLPLMFVWSMVGLNIGRAE